MSGYFSRLLPALLASVALIAVDAAFASSPAWLGAAAVLPLIAYHLAYLAPRAKSLRPAEIDSVYYLGFLITVAALAGAAFQIASAGPADFAPVLRKFAAGLVATAYAVIARLHLQSAARNESPGTPEQALDSYLSRSGLLLDNLEMAILRLGVLAEKAMAETERVVNSSQDLLERRARGTIDEFESALRTSLNGVAGSIEEVRALVTDPSFLAERQAFAASMSDGVAASRDLKASLEELTRSVSSGGDTFNRARTAVASLAGSSEQLNTQMEKLLGDHGTLASAAAHVCSASEASQRAAESARVASAGVAELAAKVGASGAALGMLEKSAAGAGVRLDAFSAACVQLSASVGQLADVLKTSQQMSAGLDRIGHQLPELAPKIQTVGREFDALHAALTSTANSLDADVQRSTRAVGLLAENLAAVAERIIERTQERQARV